MNGPSGSASRHWSTIRARLDHLRHPHPVAVVVVADRADRDLEVHLRVGEVVEGLAQVPGLAGGAQQRPGHAQLQQPLAGDDRRPLWSAARKTSLRSSSASYWPTRIGISSAKRAALRLEAERDVLDHAADLEVAGVHPLPGRHLEEVEDLVALAEAVPEHRDRAEVERGGAEPDEVGVDPVELEEDRPQVLGAGRDLEVDQALDRAAVGLHLEEVGDVVHPLDEGDDLPVALVLAGLFDPGVDVADHRPQLAHHLAFEVDDEAQDAVGRRVVRPDVDGHDLAVALDSTCSVIAPLRVGEGDRLAADREVAPLRPADVVVGQQDPGQVRVAAEDDAEEVEDFALLGLGGGEELDAGVDLRQLLAAPGSASIALTRTRSTPVAVDQLVVDCEARLGRQVVRRVEAGEEVVALAGLLLQPARARRAPFRGRRSAPPGRGRRRWRARQPGQSRSISPRISSSPGASGKGQLPRFPVGLGGLRARFAPRSAPRPLLGAVGVVALAPALVGVALILRCSLVKP